MRCALYLAALSSLAIAPLAHGQSAPSCVLRSEIEAARPPSEVTEVVALSDARVAATDSGGAITLQWDVDDTVEGHERWGSFVTWSGATPTGPLTPTNLSSGGAACQPDPSLRATLFDGVPTLLSHGVYPPEALRGDGLTFFGVALIDEARAIASGQYFELDDFAEAHNAQRAFIAMSGHRSSSRHLCSEDDRGGARVLDAASEVRLLTFTRGLPARSFPLVREHPPTSAPLSTRAAPLALAVSDDDGLAVWGEGGRLRAVSFAIDGTVDGPPRELARGEFGAPAVTARGHGFEVVWAWRESATARYQLYGASLSDRRATPTARQLTRGVSHALAPALSMQGERVVIAWSEGDLGRAGAIRAGSSLRSLEAAAQSAAVIGPASGNRRDPELSSTATATWMVLQQFERRRPKGSVRLAMLRCDGM